MGSLGLEDWKAMRSSRGKWNCFRALEGDSGSVKDGPAEMC